LGKGRRQWRGSNLGAGTPGDFSLVYEQYGNAIAHRIDSLAAGALQGPFVGRQSQGLTAIWDRAYQGIKHTLQDHPSYFSALPARCNGIPGIEFRAAATLGVCVYRRL